MPSEQSEKGQTPRMSDIQQGEDIPARVLVRRLVDIETELFEIEVQELQRRIAAKRIQRIFRSRRPMTTMSDLPTTTMNINGVTIDVGETERTVTDETEALYPKAERAKMERKELAKLFKDACEVSQTKYHLLDMKIEDPAKLRETYDLAMMIKDTRSHHATFDMTDVFTVLILDPVDPTNLLRTVDLYKDYGNVTEKEVAKSNCFYATRVVGDNAKLFSQNLQLTHKHLVNNTDPELVTKVNETYSEYPPAERGGPLFFKIMMDKLQNNSEDAATYLISVVKNLKITDYDGENVNTVVGLIRGAHNRLLNLKSKTQKSLLPEDFAETLLQIFQTSSVPEFNMLFAHEKAELELTELRTGEKKYPQVSDILSFATAKYSKLYATGAWTGVQSKVNETGFIAAFNAALLTTNMKGGNPNQRLQTLCFNCGGAHPLNACKEARDETRIAANKKQFWAKVREARGENGRKGGGQNKRGKGKPFKWAPPTEAERKSGNSHRIIDGKDHFYNYTTKKWQLTKKERDKLAAAGETPKAHVATTTTPNPSGVSTGVPATPQANSLEARKLAVANAARQIELSLRGLVSQFN